MIEFLQNIPTYFYILVFAVFWYILSNIIYKKYLERSYTREYLNMIGKGLTNTKEELQSEYTPRVDCAKVIVICFITLIISLFIYTYTQFNEEGHKPTKFLIVFFIYLCIFVFAIEVNRINFGWRK